VHTVSTAVVLFNKQLHANKCTGHVISELLPAHLTTRADVGICLFSVEVDLTKFIKAAA